MGTAPSREEETTEQHPQEITTTSNANNKTQQDRSSESTSHTVPSSSSDEVDNQQGQQQQQETAMRPLDKHNNSNVHPMMSKSSPHHHRGKNHHHSSSSKQKKSLSPYRGGELEGDYSYPSEDNMSPSNHRQMQQQHSQHSSSQQQQEVPGGLNGIGSLGSERRDDIVAANVNKYRDEQVHVNLAMADLMAYLQVVANNSNNLPLTRRDDPELGKMVSSLTSEEYARKSAAFIPADVRIIGGSFVKYGRVWDLPTSEEYNATDGAQEPGRSYGGACSNGMLKVLYDAANEAADAAQTMEASEALFDDDEDEEQSFVSSGLPLRRNGTFASLDMQGDHLSNPSTISWSDLLRKMKAEIKDIEFAQVPALTSTRKFDLSQPFKLTPDSFDPKTGKKRSLLIGCNYNHLQGAQLKASHDDVRSMKDYIVNVHGFPDSDDMMTILLDDNEHKQPTFMNITEAFKSLSEESQPGDAVFIQFSGHGGRVLDSPVDSEAESYDEVIAPSDYNNSGLVRDTLIFKTLLAPMRYGVTVTILIDCCDTGMMLELPYSWSTRADRPDHVAKMTQNDDFSFVRFLKVVKTLYETSTFTQLGNVVGSALGQSPPMGPDDDDESAAHTERSNTDVSHHVANNDKQSLFAMICGAPYEDAANKSSSKKKSKKGRDIGDATVDTRNPSLLEQVMNCTLGHPDDLSDEDTYKSNSFEDAYVDEDSTFFESIDEDDYEHDTYVSHSRRQQARRGRSRRRRN